MKRVGIILGTLILIGCATGLIFAFRALGDTRDTLDETRTTLDEVRAEQENTAKALEETQSELTSTADSLEETRQSLDEQESETKKYVELYETASDELKEKLDELDSLEDRLSVAEKAKQEIEVLYQAIQEKLALYEDTLGIQVFTDVIPPYRSGNEFRMEMINNDAAKDPTWDELLAFLRADQTDKNLYIPAVYECGNFARDIHNNAEAKGIRAALVAVHFYDEIPHAVNAFKTTDRGLVYIDDTGYEQKLYVSNLDKIAEIAKDEIYVATFIFRDDYYITQDDVVVSSIEIYW